jgi:hypothetical protein
MPVYNICRYKFLLFYYHCYHYTNGTNIAEPTEVAEAFAKQFQSVYNTTTPAGPYSLYCAVTFYTCLPLPT